VNDSWNTVSGDIFGWVVVASCVAVVVWLNFDWLRRLVGFPKAPPPAAPRWATTSAMFSTFRDWLYIRKYTYVDEAPGNAQVEMQMAVTAPDGAKFAIARVRDNPGVLLFVVNVRVAPDVSEFLKNHPHDLSEALEDVAIELSRLGAAFSIDFEEKDQINYTLELIMNEETLTEVEFMLQCIKTMRTGTVIQILMSRGRRRATKEDALVKVGDPVLSTPQLLIEQPTSDNGPPERLTANG
jgi:hypothetical protein